MTLDNRSFLRRKLSDFYWRVRWRVSAKRQILEGKQRQKTDARRIAECRFFDTEWYLTIYPDVAKSGMHPAMHYLRFGAAEGRDPGPGFSTIGYVGRYPDVTNSGLNPLLHYLDIGAAEGRLIGARDAQPPGQRVVCICGEPDSVGRPYRVSNLVAAMTIAGAQSTWMTIDTALGQMHTVAAASLLILWRTAWDDSVARILQTARSSGAVIVFDADDLVTEPHLARTSIIDGIRTQKLTEEKVEAYYRRTLASFEAADWASCSTDELAAAMRLRGKPTFVVSNGFTDAAHLRSRLAVRRRSASVGDGLVRIGYAAGTRTHQQDFAQAADAVAAVLRDHAECRLVLFRHPGDGKALLDPSEFTALNGLDDRIEWRDYVPQQDLPDEIARFDINIAPLQVGNPFCESKSEIKFVEASLVEVCTVASPTGPFRRAIVNEETGFLAADAKQWETILRRLVVDPDMRKRAGREAYRKVLWPYGPRRRAEIAASILDQILGNARTSARAGAADIHCGPNQEQPALPVPPSGIVFESDYLGTAEVTVVVPLYNYARYVIEALDSVAAQTLKELDLIVVNDASTDDSLSVAETWMRSNARRFNRVLLLSNPINAGLGATRNASFEAAETTFVLPLDADNRLLPEACEALLAAIRDGEAAFVYPLLQEFGSRSGIMGKEPYSLLSLIGGNTIDSIAITRKDCWAAVGGYASLRPQGWEDFDFWCRIAEKGLWGRQLPKILAEYRVHGASMQDLDTDLTQNKQALLALMQRRHPWLSLAQANSPLPASQKLSRAS